jgi:hypothetical protein
MPFATGSGKTDCCESIPPAGPSGSILIGGKMDRLPDEREPLNRLSRALDHQRSNNECRTSSTAHRTPAFQFKASGGGGTHVKIPTLSPLFQVDVTAANLNQT